MAAPLRSTKRKGLPLGVLGAREVAKARWAATGYWTWMSMLLVGAPRALVELLESASSIVALVKIPYTCFGSFELC